MLRVSRLTDYGTMILGCLAQAEGRSLSAKKIAAATHLRLPTAQKLLKQLAGRGLVRSERGALGGYRLARAARDINAVEILEALEGPMALTACSHAESQCELESFCTVGGAWRQINRAIRGALTEVTLSDLRRSAPGFRARTLSADLSARMGR
ncbi:MAG: SUF system Fe-S cluster assembly regulator [Gammaproteobacteria bacterium]|nr:SUF system Fe-S cluster assembly regulator [Gammaproteobacteria bacterium]